MKRLELREVQEFGKGQKAYNCQSWDLKAGKSNYATPVLCLTKNAPKSLLYSGFDLALSVSTLGVLSGCDMPASARPRDACPGSRHQQWNQPFLLELEGCWCIWVPLFNQRDHPSAFVIWSFSKQEPRISRQHRRDAGKMKTSSVILSLMGVEKICTLSQVLFLGKNILWF